jgi:hypothetical protein
VLLALALEQEHQRATILASINQGYSELTKKLATKARNQRAVVVRDLPIAKYVGCQDILAAHEPPPGEWCPLLQRHRRGLQLATCQRIAHYRLHRSALRHEDDPNRVACNGAAQTSWRNRKPTDRYPARVGNGEERL